MTTVKAPGSGHSVSVVRTDDAIVVASRPTDFARVRVTIGAGHFNVQLPNGFAYNEGDTAFLTIAELDQLSPEVFIDPAGDGVPVLTNDGFIDSVQEEGTILYITVTPDDADIAPAATQQFTATATYANGETEALGNDQGVVWVSATPAVATIDEDTGLATAVADGTTQITASVRGVTSVAEVLTVTT